MSTTDLGIEKLKENLALANKHHTDALQRVKETEQEVQQAQTALEQALNPKLPSQAPTNP